jgi:hypothetical protein
MDGTIAVVVSVLSAIVAFISIGALIFNVGRWTGSIEALKAAVEALSAKTVASDKALEEKLTQSIQAEIKRNDDIISLIASNTKDISGIVMALVQRVTKVETIEDECQGRHCGEKEKDDNGN